MEAQVAHNETSTFRPLDVSRPHHSHLMIAWSPKLGRRMTFYQALMRDAWVWLEVDPCVRTFCEWPHSTKGLRRRLIVNFWVDYGSRQDFVFVARRGQEQDIEKEVMSNEGLTSWARSREIAVQIWTEQRIRENTVALTNWKTVLHSLAANHRFIPLELPTEVVSFLQSHEGKATLQELARHFEQTDPIVVRSTVFKMLSSGQLGSENFGVERLSPQTSVRLP